MTVRSAGSATGRPQKCTGRSMAETHKDLKITADEWNSVP